MSNGLKVLIVGQGLSGSLLSWHLIKNGVQVVVADDHAFHAASRVAGGLINPITGKRLVKTWMIDDLLPEAITTYKQLEAELGIDILTETTIVDFQRTREDANIFNEKQPLLSELRDVGEGGEGWYEYFRPQMGIGYIHPAALVDGGTLTQAWRKHLGDAKQLWAGIVDYKDVSVSDDGIKVNGAWFSHLIFSEGQRAVENPWFCQLPWSVDKGEALIAAIPDLPRTHIYKNGITIVPWRNNHFWIGASHDWKATDSEPSATYKQITVGQLDEWLKVPYKIVDHVATMRPANFDRKPFVGFHPQQARLGILNGLGGKGFSLAPWFARNLANHICYNTPLLPDADVRRYTKVLSR